VRANIVEYGAGEQIAGTCAGAEHVADRGRRDVERGERDYDDAARRGEVDGERLLHDACRVLARERLRQRLRSIYKFGPARELEVLLSQQSFAQLLARWDFLLMVAEQDRQMVEEVRERKEEVETLETRLRGHLTQIERTTRQTTAENARLAKLREQRATQSKRGVSLETLFSEMQAGAVRELRLVLKADVQGSLVDQLGVRDPKEGVALRATFVIDPDNVIQHVSVNNLNVGRNPDEILRVLDGLQTDELCPCNRKVGGGTI